MQVVVDEDNMPCLTVFAVILPNIIQYFAFHHRQNGGWLWMTRTTNTSWNQPGLQGAEERQQPMAPD